MKYTSVFEKLSCIFKLIGSNAIYPIFIAVLILLLVLLLSKKLKNKKAIVLMIISYLVMFLILVITNTKSLGKVFDNISTNFFTNIYFPSIYTYLFALIVVDIITIRSLLKKNENKAYKIANGICFFIIQFLFILTLDLVAHNNIDLFSKKSLFSNKNLVILLESSINIFIIWLISIFVIYVSNNIYNLITITKTNKELDTNPVNIDINNTLVVDNPNTIEIPEKPITNTEVLLSYNEIEEQPQEVSTINNVVVNTIDDNFTLNDLIFKNNDNIMSNNNTTNNNIEINNNGEELLDKLLNNGLPLIKNNEEIVETPTKKDYSLNDYKIFNKILKDIRSTTNSNIININKELEIKLMSKYTTEEYNLFKGMLNNYSN